MLMELPEDDIDKTAEHGDSSLRVRGYFKFAERPRIYLTQRTRERQSSRDVLIARANVVHGSGGGAKAPGDVGLHPPKLRRLLLGSGVVRGSVKNLGRYAARWIAGWPNCPSSNAALT